MKRCPDCGETKALDAFPRYHRMKDGRGTYCKACHNARNRDTVKRLYGNSRHYHLRKRYGIGAAEVEELIQRQGGLCVICEQEPATQVDHDKNTGLVRAVLCDGCNGGLGAFEDDPELLGRAAAYLKKWS